MDLLGQKRWAILTSLALTLTVMSSFQMATATTESFAGDRVKRDDFRVIRDGKSVQATWGRNFQNGENYTVYFGTLIIPSAGDKMPTNLGNKVVLNFPNSSKRAIAYSLIYDKKRGQSINFPSPLNRIVYQQSASVDDTNQAVVLVTSGPGGSTYDMRIVVNRDGSVLGRALKFACNVSAWGLPIANGLLSASNISLTLISYLPGGQAAGIASTGLSKLEFLNTTSVIDGGEVVRGTVNYVVDAGKIDLTSKLTPGAALKLDIGKYKGLSGTVKSYSQLSKRGKFNVVVDATLTVKEFKELATTITTFDKSRKETSSICADLN